MKDSAILLLPLLGFISLIAYIWTTKGNIDSLRRTIISRYHFMKLLNYYAYGGQYILERVKYYPNDWQISLNTLFSTTGLFEIGLEQSINFITRNSYLSMSRRVHYECNASYEWNENSALPVHLFDERISRILRSIDFVVNNTRRMMVSYVSSR